MKINIWFLKWLFNWARGLDGLIGIITFNLVYTSYGLSAAKMLARYKWRLNENR